jgi:membrane protein
MSKGFGWLRGAARRIAAALHRTVTQFIDDRAPKMAAALAFYATFSLAPLLIFAVAIAGVVFGQDAAEGRLYGEIQGLIGPAGAATVQQLVQNARDSVAGGLATFFGVISLIFGATGVVGELQDSLNTVWRVKAGPAGGLLPILKRRIWSFAMVLGAGFLLLVSLVMSAALSAATEFAVSRMTIPDAVMTLADMTVSFVAIAGLFALIYKVIPDAEVSWRDVGSGAAAASFLFSIGKYALGAYLGRGSFASTYGAAASLVVLLLWIYYSAQILFFGAELTQVTTALRHPVAAAPGAAKIFRIERREPRPRVRKA